MVKPSKNITYNVVYSIICHQEINIIKNLINNIKKYNINNSYIICLHLNTKNYKFRKRLHSKNVIANSIFYDKVKATHLQCKPHLENFFFLESFGYNYYNFVILSSRCRFFKQMPKLNKTDYTPIYKKENQDLSKLINWWWPYFLKNKKICNFFKNKKIALVKGQNSGRFFSKELFNDICFFIKNNKIFEMIEYECYIDEILFPTLSYYYIGTKKNILCYKFGNKSEYIPNLEELKNYINNSKENTYIVKKMPDDINHPIIKYIDSL